MPRLRARLAAASLALALPLLAPAQAPDSAARPKGAWCMRPRPDCRYLFVLDVGYYRRMGGSRRSLTLTETWGEPIRPTAIYDHAGLEYGLLFRPSSRSSVGVTTQFALDAYGGRLGARGRYRRRIDALMSVEASVGPFWASHDHGPSEGPGVSADVRLRGGEAFALGVRQNVSRANGRTSHATFAGASLGGRPALYTLWLAGAATFVVMIYVVSTMDGTL